MLKQSLGEGIPAKIGLQFSTADVMPTVSVSGTGAPSTYSAPAQRHFSSRTPSLPRIRSPGSKARHILHFGGELLMEEDNSTPWGGINGATLTFTGQFTTSNPAVSEAGYADFLLGDVQSWNTNSTPKHYMRAKNPSFFAQDDIKLRPNLTINLGVRSETHGGSTEKYNNAGGFDPTLADPVRQYRLPYPVNAMGSIWFAGLNGARTQSYETKTIVMPRLGFAWTTLDTTGSFGAAWGNTLRCGARTPWADRWASAQAPLAVRPLPARQHRWCSYRGLGRICPFLQVLQPATLFLTLPLQTPREAAGRSPIPLTTSQFRTAGSGRAACNIVCPKIWWQRRNTSAATGKT